MLKKISDSVCVAVENVTSNTFFFFFLKGTNWMLRVKITKKFSLHFSVQARIYYSHTYNSISILQSHIDYFHILQSHI